MRFGVDEAGKGPVLGSMFAACVVVDPTVLPDGVGDSKTIAPARRQSLAATIRERAAGVGVAEVGVDRIDDPETDMNGLTVAAHADALAAALDACGATTVAGTVDAGETDAERFGRRVAARVDADVDLSLTAAHGADATDPVVGAASIVAKVARERHVDSLRDRYGDVGSGYPSDPTTRAFLRSYVDSEGDLPACARRSWATSADVLAAAEQSGLADF